VGRAAGARDAGDPALAAAVDDALAGFVKLGRLAPR